MALNFYKKPDAATFRKVVAQCGGNLSKVANVFGCSRTTIWQWSKQDKEFETIIKDERKKLYDELLVVARTVALGVPEYENQYDENGDVVLDEKGKPKKIFVGWRERPDTGMIKYLMGGIAGKEGFGLPEDETDGIVQDGVPIKAWIMKMNSPEE